MPFIDADLLSWEVLAIRPSKLAKTAFFGSFGFELGFKSKVRQLGGAALKASQVQNRHDWEERCLREYLLQLAEIPANALVMQEWRDARQDLVNIKNDIARVEARRGSRVVLSQLEDEQKELQTAVDTAYKRVAKCYREHFRLPTELVIQQYIKDVFFTLGGGVDGKDREPVKGFKNLAPNVLDGRRGLTWLTFLKVFSASSRLDLQPLIVQPSLSSSKGKDGKPTIHSMYSHDWKGRMNGLFRINDGLTRENWKDKPYRKKIKHIYALIEQTLTLDLAKIWESELGEAACRYLWAVPSFNGSNFSNLEKGSSNHSQARRDVIKAKSIASRTQIIVPRFRASEKFKFSEGAREITKLLTHLVGLIPEEHAKVPNAGFTDEEILRLIGLIELNRTEEQRVKMIKDLRKLLAKPHRFMSLVRQGVDEELPDITFENYRPHEVLSAAQKARLPFIINQPADIPLIPIFKDLMSLNTLDAFYAEVQEVIDRDQEEREEQEESDLESSSAEDIE
jgi:hypothetical protein